LFNFQVQTAVREQLKARVAIDGPSGAGKTFDALICATALAHGGKIAVIDTERGSARLYADFFQFDVIELPVDRRGFNPEVYVQAIHFLEDQKGPDGTSKYAVIVIDSITHAWDGAGGALDMVDQAAAKIKGGNSYVAWRSITPLHNKLVDAMLQSPCHIVCTMRSKMDYEQVKDGDNKTRINKIGLAPIQRAGMEYEFTIVFDVDTDHRIIVSKSRCAEMADQQMVKPDLKFFKQLSDWLEGGATPTAKASVTLSEPVLTIDPSWTFPNLLKVAQQQYGVNEADARAALKEAGMTSFTPDKYIAALTAIGMKFRKPVEEQPAPDFMK